ncbi:hypothetical protein TRICI_001208 [Trichomonascus ciferrii]|uniref:Uncharacterized protein n=1 Tax=Trichomonascus ciferrii TaxID=44093 RepID=A0A642V8Y5_9ASCO|nr:hypothetical protein TRICI_001208 [Trichomonascus ciferrii]
MASVAKRLKGGSDVLKPLDRNQKVGTRISKDRPSSRRNRARRALGELDIEQFPGRVTTLNSDGTAHTEALTSQWDNTTSRPSISSSSSSRQPVKLPSYVTPPRNSQLLKDLQTSVLMLSQPFDIFEDPAPATLTSKSSDGHSFDDKENISP